MLHTPPGVAEPDTKPAFVSIEAAERARQTVSVDAFRAKYADVYARMVDASVGLKRALQEFEAAKVVARELPHGLEMSDLLDGVERDARRVLAEAASAPTVAQIQQMTPETQAPKGKAKSS